MTMHQAPNYLLLAYRLDESNGNRLSGPLTEFGVVVGVHERVEPPSKVSRASIGGVADK